MLAASGTSNVRPDADRPDVGDVKLTASESSQLLAICVELIDLCSKVTARLDPAVGSVLAYARDESLSGGSTERLNV